MRAAPSQHGVHIRLPGMRPIHEIAARHPHGHRMRYVAGCRCDDCRAANSAREREYEIRRKAGESNPIVPADRARAHILALADAGVGMASVVAATDISRAILCKIKDGSRKGVRRTNEAKILAVPLDYLADGALVEVRRANQVQEQALKRRADEVRKAKDESEEAEAEGEMRQLMSRGAPDLDRLIGKVKNGFQNAYTFYFSAVLYEAAGDLNDAWVDYQRGYQIAPDNRSLQDALLRLARLRGSPDEIRETEKKVGRKAPPLAKDQGQLVVLFEDGLIPARRELFLPLPISTSSGDFRTFTVAIPYYDNRASDTGPLTVAVGKRVEQTSELVRLEALAAKDLQERLPGMLTRQALRLVAKEQMRRTAAKEGGDVGNILVGIFNTLSERADTRSWLTLPAQASSWQGMVPTGDINLTLGAGAAQRQLPLTIHKGRTTLVWVQRLGAGLTTRVMPL